MDQIVSCNTLPKSNNIKVKDQELFKIKLALSSLTNSVILCPMVANLYTQSPNDDETWKYFKRGVPGIILNYNSNRVVISLQLCLADPDSGFPIWRESLLNTSDYKATQKNFHTFKLTSSEDSMAGIRFPQDDGANIFLHDVLNNIPKLTSDRSSTDVHPKSRSLWKGTGCKKKINKSEISRPCMFTHVTGSTKINAATEVSQSKANSLRSKITGKCTKQSGSGSSIDHPDADPVQSAVARRSLQS